MANGIVKWLIGVLMVVFAVLIVVAGFKLVTSGGNPGAKEDAKNMIANAIIGIIIVLAAWLMVDTVMKGLLIGGDGRIDGKLFWSKIECSSLTASQAPRPVKLSGSQPPLGVGTGRSESWVKGRFDDEGIVVLASGECTDPSQRQCTGLAGMQTETVEDIVDIHLACPECGVVVTAGTEIGHTNACHRNGTCVDIDCRPADNSGKCSLSNITSIHSAASASGRRAVYETQDCAERDAARAAGVEAYCSSDSGYGHITGGHFSIY
ncbi:hypothetical protein KC865_01875 [Candidatus Kaiserbacteria bacterium]|nr:hypothetical protein [Candidatus Kaiserbacteria bacterium]USN92225.1 MAG: hypothetical protein H6782_00125 [Candidatus Nomurabacteria bacterium]